MGLFGRQGCCPEGIHGPFHHPASDPITLFTLRGQDEMHRFASPGETEEGGLEGPVLMPLEPPDHAGVLLMPQEHHLQSEVVPGKQEELPGIGNTAFHIRQETLEGAA